MLKRFSISFAICLAITAFAPVGATYAQSLQPITFAWTPNPQTPQVDIAIKNGLFKDAGLDVKVVSFPTGREALEALLGGQVDFAYMAEFPVATAVLRKQNLRIVADLSRYRGQRVVASAKTMELKSAKDLAGKKVGTTLGTNVEFFTHRLLANANAKAQIVNAGPSDLLPALVRGDIDAAVMFPTFFGATRKALGADYRELISDEYVLHMVITASGDIVDKRAELADKFVAALVKADAAIKADQPAAEQVVHANMKGVMPLPDLQAMWSEMEFQVKLGQDLLVLLSDEAGWIVDRGMVKAEKPTAAVFRDFVLDAPLRKASPASVTLP